MRNMTFLLNASCWSIMCLLSSLAGVVFILLVSMTISLHLLKESKSRGQKGPGMSVQQQNVSIVREKGGVSCSGRATTRMPPWNTARPILTSTQQRKHIQTEQLLIPHISNSSLHILIGQPASTTAPDTHVKGANMHMGAVALAEESLERCGTWVSQSP